MALLNINDLGIVANIAGKIFFPRKYGFGGIDFDTIIREDHAILSTISRHPVETGINITDNIVFQPKTLVVEGLVSSIISTEFFDWGISGLAAEVANNVLNSPFVSRPQTTFEALIKLQQQGIRLEVQTGLYLYQNMVITGIATRQNQAYANALRFICTLEEVVIASHRTTVIDSIEETEERPNSRSETAKTNKPTNDRVSEQNRHGQSTGTPSVLKSIWDKVVGI